MDVTGKVIMDVLEPVVNVFGFLANAATAAEGAVITLGAGIASLGERGLRERGYLKGQSGIGADETWDERRQLEEVHRRARKKLGISVNKPLTDDSGEYIEEYKDIEAELKKQVADDVAAGRFQMQGRGLDRINVSGDTGINTAKSTWAATKQAGGHALGLVSGGYTGAAFVKGVGKTNGG